MTNQRNPVGWFEIYVQDMDRAQRFYEAMLQVQLQALPVPAIKMLTFPMVDNGPGCPGALVHMPGKESGAQGTIIYFSCEDCAVEEKRALANGGKVFTPKFSVGDYGFISLVYDTEGNMIGLHSLK
ncbi:MAG: VOC family protein [Verrucomicrobiales bacterium]